MADIYEPTLEEQIEYKNWLNSKPEAVKEIGNKLLPWKLYKLNDKRVVLYSIDEEEGGKISLKVSILHKYNPEGLFMERNVFGINPDELVECDLPPTINDIVSN